MVIEPIVKRLERSLVEIEQVPEGHGRPQIERERELVAVDGVAYRRQAREVHEKHVAILARDVREVLVAKSRI
jgi:hypothetical protein